MNEMWSRMAIDELNAGADDLRAALAEANVPTLLLTLAQLTGDRRWLEDPYRPGRGPVLDDNDSGQLPDEIQAEVREAALRAILRWEEGLLEEQHLEPDDVADMLSVALVEEIPRTYGPLLAEELGQLSRDVPIAQPLRPGFEVVIIGAGVFGIGLGIKLAEAGVPFTILEKNTDVGGTWFENTYPGAGVDTPSSLYSYSFAPDGQWSRYFAKRPEVHSYLHRLAQEHDVISRVRFGHEVVRAEYNSEHPGWTVLVKDVAGVEQSFTVPVLVSAVGMVNRPQMPTIPGAETFAGPSMHTAAWDPDAAWRGKRIAVIGTGASAMQLVPAIADDALEVTVFQRSKQWAVPHPNYHRDVSPALRYLMSRCPTYTRWYRLRALWNFSDGLHESLQIDPSWDKPDVSINAKNERHRVFLTQYIKDQLGPREDLYDVCVPDYPPYGKRPLMDNGWFKAIQRDDIHLVTEAVQEIRPDAVLTADGVEHAADVLVWATGFKTLQFLWPMEIRGRSGASLAEQWGHHDARAYLGMAVPDFPNMFILNGPNTNAGHGGSAFLAAEFQIRYVMQAISRLASGQVDTMEVREDAFWAYNAELDAALSRSIWSHTGMTNWYRNEAGRVVVSSPWTYLDYWRRTRELDPTDYVEVSAPVPAAIFA